MAEQDIETEEENEPLDDSSPDELKRQGERQKEWGQQFDKWLINAARRNLIVELKLSCEYSGVTRDGNIVHCIPKRVDKYFVQVVVDKVEVWVNKMHIVGCKNERHPAKINEE